jgi:hypothetical protein
VRLLLVPPAIVTVLRDPSLCLVADPPIAASFGFNGQVSKLLSVDISPSMIPSLTIEVWFKMNEQLTDPSRSGLSHNWIIGQAFRHNGPWGNAPAALARSRGIVVDDPSYHGIAAPGPRTVFL